MKISIPLVIEVDPEKWAEARGDNQVDSVSLRRDIRSYMLATVQNAAMVDESDATVSYKAGTEW